MSELAQFKRIKRRLQRRRFNHGAILGNESGLMYAGLGRIWVRFRAGMDDDGDVTFAPSVKVNRGGATFFEFVGAPVRIVYDENDELTIKGVDNKELRAANLDSGLLNYGSKSSRWLRLKNVVRLKCSPVGTDDDPSTLVTVRSLMYDNDYGDFIRLEATARQADKIDLASYIPSAGNHAVVCVFLRTVANTYQVISSTAQAESSDIDITDYQECFAQRDAETIPIQAFILGDAQTSIDMRHLGEDLRQFVNMPRGLGLLNPVDKNTIIRSGQTVTHTGVLTVTANLTVAGDLRIISHNPVIQKDEITTQTLNVSGNAYINSLRHAITTVTANLSLDDSYEFVKVDATGGDVTVTLPAVAISDGVIYHIKKIDSSVNNVTVDGNGAETIDDQASIVWNAQYDSYTLACDGSEWSIH